MKKLISMVMCGLIVSGCGPDYQYSARTPDSDVLMLAKTTSYNDVEIWCEKGMLILDVGYGEYLSKISCTNTKIEVEYNTVQIDPDCYPSRYGICRRRYDGTITIYSNKTIPTTIEIVNSVLQEKHNVDSVR